MQGKINLLNTTIICYYGMISWCCNSVFKRQIATSFSGLRREFSIPDIYAKYERQLLSLSTIAWRCNATGVLKTSYYTEPYFLKQRAYLLFVMWFDQSFVSRFYIFTNKQLPAFLPKLREQMPKNRWISIKWSAFQVTTLKPPY